MSVRRRPGHTSSARRHVAAAFLDRVGGTSRVFVLERADNLFAVPGRTGGTASRSSGPETSSSTSTTGVLLKAQLYALGIQGRLAGRCDEWSTRCLISRTPTVRDGGICATRSASLCWLEGLRDEADQYPDGRIPGDLRTFAIGG